MDLFQRFRALLLPRQFLMIALSLSHFLLSGWDGMTNGELAEQGNGALRRRVGRQLGLEIGVGEWCQEMHKGSYQRQKRRKMKGKNRQHRQKAIVCACVCVFAFRFTVLSFSFITVVTVFVICKRSTTTITAAVIYFLAESTRFRNSMIPDFSDKFFPPIARAYRIYHMHTVANGQRNDYSESCFRVGSVCEY